MENKNLRFDSLSNTSSDDLDFNIEEVEQVVAPVIDGGIDAGETPDDTPDPDKIPDDGGEIMKGTTTFSRKFYCC
jgi:hypothetical protein